MATTQYDNNSQAQIAQHRDNTSVVQYDNSVTGARNESQKTDIVDEKQTVDSQSLPDANQELNNVRGRFEFPTEEERATLRRVADKLPWTVYMIAGVELAERFSFYGSSVVFTNFIQQPLPPGSRTGAGGARHVAGAMGMGQRASTGLTTFYQFWCYVTPLLGAWIADTRWGRYKTICIAVVIALIGHIVLIIPAIPGVIEHKSAMGAFATALIIMGLGTGLFKSNISPLIAEQCQHKKMYIITTKDGERVIVDPTLTISRIYMYFYLFINIGAFVGRVAMTYSEKFVGFYLAYTLPTIIFLLCPIILFLGRNRYVRSPPAGSVLATAICLWRHAAIGCWSWNPYRCYKNMTSHDFWENAKPSNYKGQKPAWMTFDDNWVEEVRRGLKACSVFCWFPIYWLTYNQLNNNLTSQAAVMDTHGLPNDILSNLDPLALIIFIPLCDLIFYPALRRGGLNFSALKRITLGFFTGAAAMIWAAVVQHYIYKASSCGTHAASPKCPPTSLNVWIQAGSYVLIAFSEIFASITGLEYAFTKAPKNMRSLVMAAYLFTSAISAALGEAFVSLSADPLLVWNYVIMGTLAFIAGFLFWISVFRLDADDDRLNNLAEGHLHDPSKEQ